jgi:hypothetical protein
MLLWRGGLDACGLGVPNVDSSTFRIIDSSTFGVSDGHVAFNDGMRVSH